MDFTTNQLEHIYRALKLYTGLWNTIKSVPKTLCLSDSEKDEMNKLCDKIKEEIKNRKLHT